MKLRIFSISLIFVLPVIAERESLVPEEIYIRIDECIRDYHRPYVRSWDEPEAEQIRDRAFAGLDDSGKVRALAEWIFRNDPPHFNNIASQAATLLIAPDPVIKDYSELRKLMAVESDSRRFYQLYILSAYAQKTGHDFMVDRARGLFLEGVAADRGQSTTDHPLNNISMFCFSHISERLRDENQAFKEEVYPQLVKLDFEARNLALAQWLKVNWPGCENLEIPDKSRNEKSPVDNNTQVYTGERPKKPTATDPLQEADETNTIRYLLAGMVMVIAMAAAWFVLRRQKAG